MGRVILACMTLWVVAVSAVALREAVVGAWTFDEIVGDTVRDHSPHGNDGTLNGGAEPVKGRHGQGLRFDGSSGYVEIPFDESLRVLNEGDLTLVAWFWLAQPPAENKEVFQQADANGTGRTWLFVHGDTKEIRSYLGGSTTPSGVFAEPERWYHAAVVVQEDGPSDTVQIFVDGEPTGAPVPKTMEDSEGNYLIGRHKNPSNYWDGIIDEVGLFKKALDQAEIRTIMEEGLAGALSVEPAGKLPLRWAELKLR